MNLIAVSRKNTRGGKYISYFAKKNNILLYIFLGILSIYSTGCKKVIAIDAPTTNINGNNVYQSDVTAAAVMTGVYINMTTTLNGSGLAALTLFPALSADELMLAGGSSSQYTDYIPYYLNGLTRSTTGSPDFTGSIYPTIYIINAAIEGLTKSSSLTPQVKNQLLGEARFMRAFCYFYLVNLYGDLPLALTTDYKVNAILARTPKKQVFHQIISDLKEAQALLSDFYVAGNIKSLTQERIRPNKWVATALLARTYLYDEDWENAEKEATSVIKNTNLYQLNNITEVFLKNSSETIWSLQPTLDPTNVSNTQDAKLFVLPSTGPAMGIGYYPFYLSSNVVNSFENGDLRKANWIGNVVVSQNNAPPITYYFTYKYKVNKPKDPGEPGFTVKEYTIVLRLAEQYLIRAEARAQMGNLQGGADDLLLIRKRAGLSQSNASSKEILLSAILHERQVELFMEWGHRWFDLKRTKEVNDVMSIVTPQKGGTWSPNWQLYPFRDADLQRDPNLTQNEGY